MKTIILLACLLLTSWSASADDPPFKIGGWDEVLVSVRDIDAHHRFFKDVALWELIDSGDVSRAELNAWQLPKSATAEFRVFRNPGAESGSIRLLKFNGVEQGYVRPDSQSWDTGGIFDINVRVKDLEDAANKVRALGWQARAPITQFSFGKFVVKEWIVRSPSGLAFAMIQRIEPKLEGWPNIKSLSRTFNSTQVVRDMDTSLAFYENILGFKRYLEHKGASKEAGPNVLGLPHNIATQASRTVYILHPDGVNEGSVELLSFDGAQGRDLSEFAKMPNLGIVALRFKVLGLEALDGHLKDKSVQYVHELQSYTDRRALMVRAPEGAWHEFYEAN